MIRRMLPLWVWAVIAVVFGVICIGVNVGYSTYIVSNYAQNECAALGYLKAHPTRSQAFNIDILQWYTRDGCR